MRLYKGIPPEVIRQVPPADAEHPIFNGSAPFGMLTAENPAAPSAPGGNEALKRDLDALGLKYQETEGRYGLPERSFIVHKPTLEQMYQLGKKYGQEAVIHSEGGQHKFVYTSGPNDAKFHPSTGTYDYWHEGQELPEDYYTKIPGQGAIRLHFDFDHVDAIRTNASPTEAVPQDVAAAPLTAKSEARRIAFHLVRLAKSDGKFHEQFAGQTLPFYGVDNNMFKLGDNVYEAESDPDDGYRSYLDTINHVTPPQNSIFFKQPIAHVRVERFDHNGEDYVPSYRSDDDQQHGHPAFGGYRLVDAQTGHPWLTVGTNYHEDYYPHFHFEYNPPRDTEAHNFQQKVKEAQDKSARSQIRIEQNLRNNRPGADPLASRRRELGTQPLPDRAIPPPLAPAPAPAPQPKEHDTSDPMGTSARFRNLELHERQAVGHALYKHLTKLTKAYVAVAGEQMDDPAPAAAKTPMRPFRHPLSYDWHDGHTDHHYLGHTSGGVLVRRGLAKQEAPAPLGDIKHPHTDGAIPKKDSPEHASNDQVAGKGVATYRQFALPFGSIQPGKSDLFHYDYRGKQPEVDKLVADHGYKVYYAGGKFGKPDLGNRNYNTGHLMVYDPTPQSGGDFGDEGYTDAWRKTHELAHALSYPELNRIYGEGRRIGKLGVHRSTREALRAVHWEWLAAHKQRELNKQLGMHVPDEVFNRELNTVMHDAVHRAVTGKFTEPSDEGFVPHSHKVPLETALGMVREHARNLGLQGDNDTLPKNAMAKKELSIPEALKYLHDGLQQRIEDFAKEALALRQKETLAKKEELEKALGLGAKAALLGGAITLGGVGAGIGVDQAAKHKLITLPKISAPASPPSAHGAPTPPMMPLFFKEELNPKKTCPECKGKGSYTLANNWGSETFKCSHCMGHGKILAEPKKGDGMRKEEALANGNQDVAGINPQGGTGGEDNMYMAAKKKFKKGAAADAPDGESGYAQAAAIDSGSGMALKEKNMKKNMGRQTLGPRGGSMGGGAPAPAPAAPTPAPPAAPAPAPVGGGPAAAGKILPGDLAKHDHMCKCESCGKVEHYAKSALAFNKSTKEEDDQWEADKVQAQLDSKKQKQSANPYRKDEYEGDDDEHGGEAPSCPSCGGEGRGLGSLGSRQHYRCRECGMDYSHDSKKAKKSELQKKSPPGRKKEVEDLKAKGMPASEAFGIAWKQNNEKGKPHKKAEPNTFVDNSKGKGKLPPEKGGEKVTPKKHAEGGNDGMDTTAGKKLGKAGLPMAGGAGGIPKAPAAPKMAGSAIPPPHPAMKPMKLPGVSMKPKMPKSPVMGAGSTAGAGAAPAAPGMGKAELAKAGPASLGPRSMQARRNFGERTMKQQAAKLPGVRASVGSLMDSMLQPKLPATQGAVPGVGHKVARPAQGVQTMAERVASRVPAGPPLKTPPASMKPMPKSLAVVPSLQHLASQHMPVAAASPEAPALGDLAREHMANAKLPKPAAKKPVQTMAERVASKMPAHASLAVPGEKSHQQLLGEARKAEKKPYAEPDKNTKTLFEDPEPKVLHPSDKKKPLEKKYGAKGMAEKSAAARKAEPDITGNANKAHRVKATAHGKEYSQVFTSREAAEKFAEKNKHRSPTIDEVELDHKTGQIKKMEYGLALSELGPCALCKKAEHSGPCT